MKALSIRQPWAWLILHGGKDIENRDWPTRFRGRVLIHASKGMTFAEHQDAYQFTYAFNHDLALNMPSHHSECLERGGIVGSVEIVDCVTRSDSRWFCGTYGFVLRNPVVLPFKPYRGALGFFDVQQEEMAMTTAEFNAFKASLSEDDADKLEHRVAIVEEGCKCSREEANRKAVEMFKEGLL